MIIVKMQILVSHFNWETWFSGFFNNQNRSLIFFCKDSSDQWVSNVWILISVGLFRSGYKRDKCMYTEFKISRLFYYEKGLILSLWRFFCINEHLFLGILSISLLVRLLKTKMLLYTKCICGLWFFSLLYLPSSYLAFYAYGT